MPRSYFSKHIIRVLENHGFSFVSQRGSHTKYKRVNKHVRTVIVPHPKKDIPHGTFRSIVRQSGLEQKVFEK